MLVRISTFRSQKKRRKKIAARDPPVPNDTSLRELIFNQGNNIDWAVALNGFAETLKRKNELEYSVVVALDNHIHEFEYYLKEALNVDVITYSDTLAESSSSSSPSSRISSNRASESEANSSHSGETSSGSPPPPPKRPCTNLRGPDLELYVNSLQKKIRKLFFSVNDPEYILASVTSKKVCFRRFIEKAGLTTADVTAWIVKANL